MLRRRLPGVPVCGRCSEAAPLRHLPMGVAEGCTLRHAVPKDRVLTYADVELPPGRLVDKLRAEQSLLPR